MKTLNRDKIQRMFGQQAGGAGGSSVNYDGDGVSKLWVEQNYLSKEFFLRLFNIHGEDENDDPVDVQPNDLETTITDIEAMFGFWTEQYLSALGQNSEQGGGGITLNAALASINNSPLGNPTGSNTVLMFNGTTWVYASMGSTDMNTVWTALAAATNQQINISHLTTALSGYATTSQLSDYATVTDLEQLASYFNTLSGYFTNGAANEAVKLETARTIWGQQFDGTANVSGDITQATCLEFSGIAGTATNGGFIDFHYAGGGADYTSRIIEDVSGVLKINNTIWAQLSGNVSIGTPTISQTYKLDVAGYTKTTRLYLADGVYLEYDSTNSGVHLVGAGFYSDSYVSALGVNSGGGGGGTDYIPLTGSSSITGTLAPSVATADLGSATNKWRNIYGTSLSISNTLTTYALTVNSSATVVGSLTATNGNLVASTGYVSSAGGYKVTGSDNTSVLLAGGGTKPLSEIGSAYTLPAATAAALGGLKVNQSYGQAVTVQASGNTGTRNYGLQIDSNGMGFVYVPWENTDNDTKNTAGATNLTATKMYLVGATEQSTNPQTYSNTNCYIGKDNCLYSGGSKVLTGITSSNVTTALGFTPAATSDLNNYLPLTAGSGKTLTGALFINVDNTYPLQLQGHTLFSVIHFCDRSGSGKTDIGWLNDNRGNNAYIANVSSAGVISVNNNGAYFSDNTSNFNKYKLATESWVTSQGYLTNAVLSGYVKAVIINSSQPIAPDSSGVVSLGSYLPLSGGVLSANNSWLTPAKLQLMRPNTTAYTDRACIGITDGNIHIDSYPGHDIYLNYYSGNKKVYIGSYTVYHSGNLSLGSMAYESASDYALLSDLSDYLPLSGGTISGILNIDKDTTYPLELAGMSKFCVIHYKDRNRSDVADIGWLNDSRGNLVYMANVTSGNNGVISVGNGGAYYSDNVYNFKKYVLATQTWVTSQGYLTSGDVVTTNTTQNITGAKTFTATLTSSAGGSFTGGLRFYSLCVECASDGTPSSSRYGEINRYNNTLHLQYDSGTGGVTMCRQGFTFTNPGTTSQLSTSNKNLQIAVGTGDAYVDKAWVINSDMRKKDIAQYINIDINSIADAPVFNFTWKNDITRQLTLGTSAQYWQKVFPNAVRTTPDGYLGMDYSSIALVSSVLVARKVVDHEARIRLLEVENAALRNEINQLKKVA